MLQIAAGIGLGDREFLLLFEATSIFVHGVGGGTGDGEFFWMGIEGLAVVKGRMRAQGLGQFESRIEPGWSNVPVSRWPTTRELRINSVKTTALPGTNSGSDN
jgi:hypothetical protein